MYDRKTWIVVIACSVLLAVNLYFSQQTAKERAAQEALQPAEAAAAAGESEAAPEVGALREVEAEEPPAPSREIALQTAETTFTLTSRGGGVKQADLTHQQSVHDEALHVVLNEGASSPVGALADGPDRMETVNYAYQEEESVAGEKAVFLGKHPSGLVVKKTWSVLPQDEPGAPYLLDLTLEVQNPKTAETQIPLESFSLFLGRAQPLHGGELTPSGFFWRENGDFHFEDSGKFKGSWFSSAKSVIVESAPSMDYAGLSSQLFATALRSTDSRGGGIWAKGYEATLPGEEKRPYGVRAGFVLPAVNLAPGQQETLRFRLFMGPKDNRMLRRMGDGWGDMMNYGFFSPFSRFMNFLLVNIHDGVAKISGPWSWGWAIIIVTLVVRFAMWPLYAKSNRTMKRMGKLKPEMDRLKEKYPDDPAKMQQEVMQLYRKFGINPLGGCLPMLVQIPIFFGFYRMLQYAVELRGHGFLWVDDLSKPDTVGHLMGLPINILPIVMGLSSFAQISMMPSPSADKTQQTIMKLMPIMFFVFCYNFASALALYWTTSNLFSIFQTWFTQRMPEPELKERAGGGGKSFMEKMAEAAEQQQRMKQARGRVVESEPPKDKKKRGPRTGG